MKLKGYKNYRLNRNRKAGGVIIYFKEDIVVDLIKKNKDCEIIWVKIKDKYNDLVIGGIYSPCEDSVPKKEIEEITKELKKDILEIKNSISDKIILVGDYNAHMGNDEEGIQGNHQKIGINGREYRKMIKENDLVLCNNSNKCYGRWTREQSGKKSILDLTISTNPAYELIEKITIDDEHKYCLESKRAKTDHNITFVEIAMKIGKESKKKRKIYVCNNDWLSFEQALETELDGMEENYKNLDLAIQKASRVIITPKYMKNKKKMMGYNDNIRTAIKERRKKFREWKKEKEPVRKKELELEYSEQKQNVIEMMERAEAEEMEKIVNNEGKEKLDFWKTMKS